MTNTRDELIWMAGFFDGEGCVNIGRKRRANPRPEKGQDFWWKYILSLQMANRCEEPLRRFHRRFGGTIYPMRKKGVLYWRWGNWSDNAAKALTEMLPYLLNKRPIAEVGLRFQEAVNGQPKKPGRRGHSADWLEQREMFYLQARELNKKSTVNNRAPKYEGPSVALRTVH